MFEQKRFAGRHLLTFESQKLNYLLAIGFYFFIPEVKQYGRS